MTAVIVCRSVQQQYEDDVLELHTRFVAWQRELRNERCFTSGEVSRKASKLLRMQKLIDDLEGAIVGDQRVDLYRLERKGIDTASMLHP